jgi:hypothetical protein
MAVRSMWRGVKHLAAAMGLVLGLGIALAAGAQAQEAQQAKEVKRLILTDGSYQTATDWKIKGDRVAYFSAERGEWEEIPVALVDWGETLRWNAAAAQKPLDDLKQESGEEIAARKEEELNTPQVAPKEDPELRLPAGGGVFLLEDRAGKQVLFELAGSKSQENNHEGKNLLKRSIVPIPITSRVQTTELPGTEAKVRVRTASPSIFVDVENQHGVVEGEFFRIVRLEKKKDVRVVATTKVGPTGEQSVEQTFLHSTAEKLGGDWWKVILLEALKPGEYAIVMDDAVENGNGLVWDFGVDK